MKHLLTKIKLIYLPFLAIAVAMIGGYTFVHWLLLYQLNVLFLKDHFVEFFIPAALILFAIYVWLRTRIAILELHKKNGDDGYYFFYQVMVFIAIMVPTCIAQGYVTKSTGNLRHLSSMSELYDHAPEKYYSTARLYMDKDNVGVVSDFGTAQKGQKFVMSLYLAVPVYAEPEDVENRVIPYAWYGVKYQHSIRNSLRHEDKVTEFNNFAASIEEEFKWADIYKFDYLRREGNTNDRDLYEKAARSSSAFVNIDAPVVIFTPQTGDFATRTGSTFEWIFYSFGIGAVVFFLMISFPRIAEEELAAFHGNNKAMLANAVRLMLLPFKLERRFFVTPILIGINILIFLIMTLLYQDPIEFNIDTLIRWGAHSHNLVLVNGEWWRLLTSTMIHAGLGHVLMNMIALYLGGAFLEHIVGRWRVVVVYITTGLFSSLCSVFWYDNTVSVGASGAIMGLYGAVAAFCVTKYLSASEKTDFLVFFIIFVVSSFLYGLMGDVDNAAHIGGLLSGFIIGLIMRYTMPANMDKTSIYKM